MLQHKASRYPKDNDGWTALTWEYLKNHKDSIAILEKHKNMQPCFNVESKGLIFKVLVMLNQSISFKKF